MTRYLAARCALISLTLLSFVACGGGGGGGVTSSPAPPVPTATPTLTNGSTTVTVGSTAQSTALPAVGGYTGTLQLPSANTSSTVTINASTTVPAGVPAPQARRAVASANVPLLYLGLTAAAAVTLSGTPQISVTLPAGTDLTKNFYLGAYLGNSGWVTFNGPGRISGSTVSFSAENGSVTLSSGVALDLVLYEGQPLQNELTAAPSAVQLLSLTDTQTISVSDLTLPSAFNVSNTFAVVDSTCGGIAAVSQPSAATFQVGAVATGTCGFSVSDSFGNVSPVTISVTTTAVVTQ